METTIRSPAWEDKSSFQMIDVGGKETSVRKAWAEGVIHLKPKAFITLAQRKNPKGDVLALAEVAGILAAKKTSDSIPLCHPLSLDFVRLQFSLNNSDFSVRVVCAVGTNAKTGVEMEALAGVNGALLTIYDLSKVVDPEITISGIRLLRKEGGKSGVWLHPQASTDQIKPETAKSLQDIRFGVLTVSDRVSAGTAHDRSGVLLKELLTAQGAVLAKHSVVADEIECIQSSVRDLIENQRATLVVTTGGTGLSPRDVTPQAISPLASVMIEGIGELLRSSGSQFIKTAWLSRSFGCIVGGALVIALPGSKNAVAEGFNALLPILPHSLHTLKGGDHA